MMTSTPATNPTYGRDQVCRWFEINPTTLFRWEKNGEIPPTERGLQDQRIYRQEHLKAVAKKVRKLYLLEAEKVGRLQGDEVTPSSKSMERLYKAEILAGEDYSQSLWSLEGLNQQFPISLNTIRDLAEYAFTLGLSHPFSKRFWKFLVAISAS